MRALCSALLFAACTPTKSAPVAPPPRSPALPARPVASAPTPDPVADAGAPMALPAEVRFVVRLRTRFEDSVDCFPIISPPSVLSSGAAWIAGSCGLRALISPRGKLTDYRAPSEDTQFDIAGVKGNCPATAYFRAIFGRSASDAIVTGDRRCGLDPNTIWVTDPLRFDGRKWRRVKTKFFFKNVHDSSPDVLAGNSKVLYALALGDDWHGAPECGVYRFQNSNWVPDRQCLLPTATKNESEQFLAIAVAPDGHVWVAGRHYRGGAVDHGAVWEKTQKGWVEHAVADEKLSQVAVGPDGRVWAAGKSLWRLDDGAFHELTATPEGDARSLWVGKQVWLSNGAPWRLVGGKLERVAVDEDEDDFVAAISGSGSMVWATGEHHVWSLTRDGSAPEPLEMTFDEPKR